jgi:hypothetical protein
MTLRYDGASLDSTVALTIRSDSPSSRSDIRNLHSEGMHFGQLCDKKFYYTEWETLIAS